MNERDEIAAVPRCPGCGSAIDPKRHTCYPLTVDATQPGYRYLEGIWGYCLTLSRDVRIGEDWLTERDRRVQAATLRAAAEDAAQLPGYYRSPSRWSTWLAERANQIEAS